MELYEIQDGVVAMHRGGGAGVVWAELIFPSDFWKVTNVHGLFEIFGAVATSCAVIIALMTMNSWKRQAKAEDDHELARRVVIILRSYPDGLVLTWSCAESSTAQIRGSTWIRRRRERQPYDTSTQ